MVPSNEMVIDPKRKEKIIQHYKVHSIQFFSDLTMQEKMKEIPCKYYDGGRGSCKFGSNCHYAHRGDLTVEGKRQLTGSLFLNIVISLQMRKVKLLW